MKAQGSERIADFVSEHGGGQAALGELALLFQFGPLSFALGRSPEAIGHDADATDDERDRGNKQQNNGEGVSGLRANGKELRKILYVIDRFRTVA